MLRACKIECWQHASASSLARLYAAVWRESRIHTDELLGVRRRVTVCPMCATENNQGAA
jgi:hypothetical protein